jgi:hypothetical protein
MTNMAYTYSSGAATTNPPTSVTMTPLFLSVGLSIGFRKLFGIPVVLRKRGLS